jgi:hypothetical protein
VNSRIRAHRGVRVAIVDSGVERDHPLVGEVHGAVRIIFVGGRPERDQDARAQRARQRATGRVGPDSQPISQFPLGASTVLEVAFGQVVELDRHAGDHAPVGLTAVKLVEIDLGGR